ncbi:MAG TPA: translation initiation factor IF-2 [Methylocella sp.]|jgi:translation initiation factor IF-2
MNDSKNPGDTLSVAPARTLTLKRPVEAGIVRQSFSHGRSKAVVVEKVKRRAIAPGEAHAPREANIPPPPAAAPKQRPQPVPARPQAPPQRNPSGVILRSLTEEERESRSRALSGAREREVEERRRAEIEAKAREEREAREREEHAAAEARKLEEESRRAHDAEAKRRSESEAKRRLAGGEPAPSPAASALRKPAATMAPAGFSPAPRSSLVRDEEGAHVIRRPGMPAKTAVPRPVRGAAGKNRGRLTVANVTGEEEERTRSVASFRRRVQRLKGHVNEAKEKLAREVILPETITIQELASRMSERGVDVIKLLMKQGQMAKITDVIDADTAQLVAEELGHTVKRVAEADVEEGLFDAPDSGEHLVPRPPVVTIMGHVDHGKTSLLDAIRHANVVSGEAGGITQHIGAYQIAGPDGAKITFIDTPGHAAFTAMRARGAKITDIVVLVVAADDGVMPQTAEAIAHARAANVPMIVAINKIDKPDAKPERVRSELLQHEVQVESLGGETLEVEVSATKNINLDKLLDLIALQAELLNLQANPARPTEGTVIEARLDKGRGPVATVLVQRGTLKVGDLIVGGSQWGRVRALLDDKGVARQDAGPSMPVEVLGFSGSPEAGDRVAVVDTEARAREITEYRERQRREKAAVRGSSARGSLSDMMSQLKTAGRKEFPLVIKGDVQGSVEAIVATLEKLNTEEVAARVIHAGAGGITESDITLAEASGAAVIGFNVRAHKEARALAEQSGIEIRYYNIIYNLVDDVKAAMSGLLSPTLREEMLGNAQILEVFTISKVGKVAGCRVTEGTVQRGAHVRLIRDNVVVHEGKLSTLKRFKDEVKEVQAGQECGMAFENYQDMRTGDVIECYTVQEIKRSL